ncbi:unnamed protein product [Linum tenue]|uniref:Uncharacterized protein n=1 Tax=Linum tenue TaxID=586396 RepID=A0AAV0Q4T9_9ROSI|nr:unnamed protein product [Linum tenue]
MVTNCRQRGGEAELLLLEGIWDFAQCMCEGEPLAPHLLVGPQVILLIREAEAEAGLHLIHLIAVGADLIIVATAGFEDRILDLLVIITGAGDPTLVHHQCITMHAEDLTQDLHHITVGPPSGDGTDLTHLMIHDIAHQMIGMKEEDEDTLAMFLRGRGVQGETIQAASPAAQ